MLRVVKGKPTPEEFAAVVAVIQAKVKAAQSVAEREETARSRAEPGWAAYWRRSRQPLRPGPGAWRASALPR